MDDPSVFDLIEEATLPTNDTLTEVSELAQRRQAKALEIERLEEELKVASAELRELDDKLIPDAMATMGLQSFALEDGTKLEVVDVVDPYVKEEDRPAFFEWLAENGFGDLVKHQVVATFGKGEAEEAENAMRALAQAGVAYEDKESVHPQTLKAWTRERIETAARLRQPAVFPESLTIYQGRRAKIVAPKKRRGRGE